MGTYVLCAVVVAFLTSVVRCACIPEVPHKLLSDPVLLEHPAVVSAFRAIQQNLDELFVNTTRDALSFAVVSTS
jgi:hypothetical protein